MNSVIGGLLTSGRSTARSIATPSATMMTSVTARLTKNGTPCSRRPTKVSAANRTMRALREIQDARRLVDQHEADRDQRVHDAGQQTADQHLEEERIVEVAHAAPPRGVVVMSDAEIGVDDGRIGTARRPARRRRSCGRSRAPRSRSDRPITTPISCSMRTTAAPNRSRAARMKLRSSPLFGRGHSRHRLVEQEDLRLGDQRAGEFDPLLQAIGQARRPGARCTASRSRSAMISVGATRARRPPRRRRAQGR